jgi:hypothetical protein
LALGAVIAVAVPTFGAFQGALLVGGDCGAGGFCGTSAAKTISQSRW